MLSACKYRVAKLRVLLIGLFLVIFLPGCSLLPKEQEALTPPLLEPEQITYDTIDVKKGTIEKKIIGSAYFTSAELEDYFFKYHGGILRAINVKVGDKVNKGDILAELDTDSLKNQIEQQGIYYRIAQIDYESTKNSQLGNYAVEKASLNVKLAKLKFDELNDELAKSKLISTMSGEVVFVADLKVGSNIDAFQRLIEIADPSKLQLEYSEDRALEFKAGMNVEIDVDGNKYNGKVAMDPGQTHSKTVIIQVEGELPHTITIGSSATISVTLQKRENTIALPRNLVKTFEGREIVQVLKNGNKIDRDVQVGMQTETEIEILKGLEVGEKIIVG